MAIANARPCEYPQRRVNLNGGTAMQKTQPLPPTLALIAVGRDHINTEEFAKATIRASQTIRKNYCLQGECFGIVPIKFGNRLLWPVGAIAELLNGSNLRTKNATAPACPEESDSPISPELPRRDRRYTKRVQRKKAGR
jgi:hypothetical protein